MSVLSKNPYLFINIYLQPEYAKNHFVKPQQMNKKCLKVIFSKDHVHNHPEMVKKMLKNVIKKQGQHKQGRQQICVCV